ncbi:hypothetical protein C8Q72DRAFT_790903 [Fomitopsis betulina]|nr:hypothetical protein C8Q72DRAFT_790903 [Fomitopsis betulina]
MNSATMQASPTSSDDTLRSDLWGTASEVETLVGEDGPPLSLSPLDSPPDYGSLPNYDSSSDRDSDDCDSDDEYCRDYELYIVHYDRGHGVDWNLAISTFARRLHWDLSGPTTNIGALYQFEAHESGVRVNKQQNVDYESLVGWGGSILVSKIDAARFPEAESIILSAVEPTNEGTGPTCCSWTMQAIGNLSIEGFKIEEGWEDNLQWKMNTFRTH